MVRLLDAKVVDMHIGYVPGTDDGAVVADSPSSIGGTACVHMRAHNTHAVRKPALLQSEPTSQPAKTNDECPHCHA